MNSLQQRLQLTLALGLLLFMLALWIAGSRLLETLASDLIATQLADDATSLLSGLAFAPDGTPRPRAPAPAFAQPFSGHYYTFVVDGQQHASRSLWDERLPVTALAPGTTELLRLSGPQAQRLLVRSGGYRKGERQFTLAVAADLAPIESHRRRLGYALVVFTVAAALLLGVTQHAVLRLSFRSLDSVRESVAALEAGASARLAENVPREVLPLVREVNRLLATLARRLARSRNALGDLAHALKMPLQLLTDDLGRDPVGTVEAADARVQIAHIGALVGRELKRARLAGSSAPAERFMLPSDLEALCMTVRQLHRERDLMVDYSVEGSVSAFGEREDVHELLGNLLDNACKWARHRVQVDISAKDVIAIDVRDDGPGIARDEIATALARGARLDESRGGHGLGLAIVGDIVAAYGGRLEFLHDDVLGGLRVSVELPLEETIVAPE